MTTSGSFTCPACGADFDVQERLGELDEPTKTRAEEQIAPNRAEEAVSFQCPACGADFETQEHLAEEAEASH